MRVVFHSGGVFILLGWLGVRGNQYCPIGQRAGRRKKGKKGAGGRRAGRLGWHIFLCWLREMDFLNILAKWYRPDATARDSPSGLIAGFW
ncbi:MAG: hypothetical protein OSJ53_00840 [Kineothrix sp.]|nr:hypothetical protein [Kineothrix sp.]